MNDARVDRLNALLPAIYRIRDSEQGEPLKALLQVISEQVDLIEDDIAGLYENWFIETCEDWVVPYIGDLIGYEPVHEAGEPSPATNPQQGLRNQILFPRREVEYYPLPASQGSARVVGIIGQRGRGMAGPGRGILSIAGLEPTPRPFAS